MDPQPTLIATTADFHPIARNLIVNVKSLGSPYTYLPNIFGNHVPNDGISPSAFIRWAPALRLTWSKMSRCNFCKPNFIWIFGTIPAVLTWLENGSSWLKAAVTASFATLHSCNICQSLVCHCSPHWLLFQFILSMATYLQPPLALVASILMPHLPEDKFPSVHLPLVPLPQRQPSLCPTAKPHDAPFRC